MSTPDAHKPTLPEPGLAEVAARFAEIASSIEAGNTDASIMALMEEGERLCGHTVPGPDEAKELLPRLVTMLQTWRTVWQRLGRQHDFRLAVVREARLWSARIAELGQRARSVGNGRVA